MASYARLSHGHSRSRPEEAWSEHEWLDVFAVMDNLDAPSPQNGGSGAPDWPVGARRLRTMPATTDRISQVEAPPSFSWYPKLRSQDGRQEGLSADQLLDDLRRAMERNPEATRAAVAQMVTFLTPPAAVELASARGGLAPWQKRKVDRYLRENWTARSA